jgi:hypothetical protein
MSHESAGQVKNSSAGAGLSRDATPSHGWLRRSGFDWVLRSGRYADFLPGLVFASWFLLMGLFGGRDTPRWLTAVFAAGLVLSLAYAGVVAILRAFVRCRVCGLRVASCGEARVLAGRKWAWVASLEACPVCGDDGRASPESRSRWLQSGSSPEPPYWSRQRIAIAVLLTLLLAGGGWWYGASWRPSIGADSHDGQRGAGGR